MTDTASHAANKKAVVTNLHEICSTDLNALDAAVANTYADDARLFAFHPVNEHEGPDAIANALWRPIRQAFPDVERRDQIVLAGDYKDASFVGSFSYLQGMFARDFHDVPATHGNAYLRCCEINRVETGKIVEAWVLIDLLDLMHQAGCWPIAVSLGAEGGWRSPATMDGLDLEHVDGDKGAATLDIVKKMHAGLAEFDGRDLSSMAHAEYWTPDFMWYGPAGIGTTRGLAGFEAHHQIPFLRAFPDRRLAGHVANIADGNYVLTGGWPSVIATHTGPDWLNTGPTGREIHMRVMDFYRVENGLIAENWVPIDIIDILRQMDIDVLARLRHLQGRPRTRLR